MKLLITRAEPHASQLATLLNQKGIASASVQVMTIAPVVLTGASRSTLLDLDSFATIIVVSANAARGLADHIDQYWPQLPINIHWVAIGQGTANELVKQIPELSLSQIHIPDGTDSEALLSLSVFESIAHTKILIAKGEGGRELIRSELAGRGAKITELSLYRRVANVVAAEELVRELEVPLDWVQVASGDSFLHILTMLEGTVMRETLKDLAVTWLVPSERVASVLILNGISVSNIICCSGASNSAVVSAMGLDTNDGARFN